MKNIERSEENNYKMCAICLSYKCLPFCPNFEGESYELGHPIGKCGICGRYIYWNEEIRADGDITYCEDCYAELEIND